MHTSRKKIIIAVAVVAVVLGAAWGVWWVFAANTPEYRVRALFEEWRAIEGETGAFEELLVDWGLRNDRNIRMLRLEEEARALDKTAVPALIQTLKDEDPKARWFAATVLRAIGPLTKDVVPALTEALKDKDADVRGAASWALEQIKTVAPSSE